MDILNNFERISLFFAEGERTHVFRQLYESVMAGDTHVAKIRVNKLPRSKTYQTAVFSDVQKTNAIDGTMEEALN